MKLNSNYLPLSKRVAELQLKTEFNPEIKNAFDPKKTTGNVSIRSDLSKAGLANVFMGHKQSGINKNPNLENNLMESEMKGKLILPIKAMIIEEGLTNFIQNNASKISGGLLLGTGAAAAHAAHGGDFGFGGGGDNPPPNTPGSDKWNNMSDYEKDVAKNSISTDVHDATKPRGFVGNITHSLGTGLDNIKSENKIQDMKDAHEQYLATRDGEGRLLSNGQVLGLGAGVLGTGALAAKLKSGRRR